MSVQKIGRYEIKSELGRGGMSVVYRAYDPRFKREVALKMMAGDLRDDPKLRARFEREAQTIAALEHGAIVPVYDFGEEDGRLFLVMRMMTGGTLAGRLKEGPLSTAETATVLRRIGAALDHAHSQGIIHRDLKPSNILFDQHGDPFLADFGIARLVAGSTTLTGKGAIGTPAYMSPEQVYGDERLDGRTDIYALGVICFEMLTGRQPFEDETPARVMMKHVMDPTPSARKVKPDVPRAVDAAIRRAMAKQPDDRFNTAEALVQALLEAAGEEAAVRLGQVTQVESEREPPEPVPIPVEAAAAETAFSPPQSAVSRAAPGDRPMSRRLPSWVRLAGGILISIVVIGVIGGGIWLATAGLRAEEADVRPTTTAGDRAAQPTSFAMASRRPPPTPEDDEEDEAQMHLAAAYEQIDAGAYEAALEALNQAIALSPEEPVYYFERAFVYRLLEDVEAAVADYTRAIELEPEEARFYVERGALYREMGRADAAVADHVRAVELNPEEAAYRLELGVTYREVGDLEASLAAFDAAVEMEPGRADAYAGRAWSYYLLGELERAVADYDLAIERDPENAAYYQERGIAQRELGNLEAALADFNRAISLAEGVAHFYEERGNTYRDWLEDPEAALADFSMAIELEPENAVRYLDRALTFRRLDDPGAAMEDLGRCLDLDPEYYWCYWERALLHDALGETEAAVADFEAFLDTVYGDDCLECQEEAAQYIADH